MSVFKLSPPMPPATTWWRISLVAAAGEPLAIWYEVSADGKALRSVEVMPDGSMRADDIERYPSGVSPAGFGSLIGAPFFELDWSWPDAGEADPVTPLAASEQEFDVMWAAATA